MKLKILLLELPQVPCSNHLIRRFVHNVYLHLCRLCCMMNLKHLSQRGHLYGLVSL